MIFFKVTLFKNTNIFLRGSFVWLKMMGANNSDHQQKVSSKIHTMEIKCWHEKPDLTLAVPSLL